MPAAVILGAVCLCLGASASARLRLRAACLRAWQRSLLAMHAACAYQRATCAQVLRAGASARPELLPIARAVETTGADAAVLFARRGKDRLLRPEEEGVLREVMSAVAGGDRSEIGAALDYALERFGEFCRAGEKKRDADAAMYVTLGLLLGVCVFLILC